MKAQTHSVLELGFDGIIVDVECHISNGLPNIVIVGFATKAVDEAKERIRSAFASSQIQVPKKRIIINLAPADVPKDSTGFDLSMALSVLSAANITRPVPENVVVIGELGLDGSIRAVRGIIGRILAAKRQGFTHFIIPKDNLEQIELIEDISVLPVSSLWQVYQHFTDAKRISAVRTNKTFSGKPRQPEVDLQDIIGQVGAKRALEVAVAGGHNLLLNGPPGTGKSMLAKAAIGLLPPLSPHEALEVTHIHSLASPYFDRIITERPLRSPHHSASDTAIIGGGKNPRPGEISLSHRGILFFDEFPEFSRPTLESLRQPLEDRVISVSRAKETITFPANFMLIATANPCPCGYFGTHRECTCSPQEIARYQRKLSGPIMDRIDIFSDVENIEHSRLLSQTDRGEATKSVADRIIQARRIQADRFGSTEKTNSDMTSADIKLYAKITSEAKVLLDTAAKRLELSPRSYMRTIKVARTIADLANESEINTAHITEAVQFRPKKLVMV